MLRPLLSAKGERVGPEGLSRWRNVQRGGALEPRSWLTRVLRKHSRGMDAADWPAEVSQINIGRDAPGLIVYHH